ncbi:FLYWCH zinc finger domain-containing protein [Phthorimaea operculella]|nr:FLYWCH zinc finger domain-containing protein [Phthorimaea operculella]
MIWVRNTSGKQLAIYKGNSFFQKSKSMTIKTWYCTRQSSDCKARFTTTIDGSLVQVSITYVLNRAGKKIAVYGGNSFYLHKVFGSTKRWPCTRYGMKCRACLTTTMDVQWVHNRCGKELLVFGGYSFYQQQRNRKTDRWACTSLGGVRNCRARIMVTKDRKIVNLLDAHNHAPPKYLIENGIFFSTSGKDILLLDGFSYYMQSQAKTTDRWVCTSNSGVRKCRARVLLTKDRQLANNTVRWLKTRTGKQIALINGYLFYCGIETATTYAWRCSRWSRCKARFILGKNMKMLRANIEHNHQPSAFIIRDGIYIRV